MNRFITFVGVLLLIAATAFCQIPIPQNASTVSHQGGTYYASGYATWSARVISGNQSTGSQSIIVAGNAGGGAGGLQLADGTTLSLNVIFGTLTPIIVDFGQGNQETVTPTAASVGTCPAGNLGVGGVLQCVTLTASFSNTHGQSAVVVDGSFGLQSAINHAQAIGGGLVVVDGVWAAMGGTNAIISAAVPFASVSIEDARGGIPRYWNGTPTGAAMAAPTALTGQTACDATHQFCSDSTVAGSASYAGGTLFGAITCVDIWGNESAASSTASFTDVSAKAIDIKTPAAQTGCVGWIPYLSLDAGTYAQAFKITPTAAICTLSPITPIPACAITNTTYGLTGSTFGKNALFNGGAQITAIALNTAQHFPALGSTAMTAASLTPITNASVSYAYAPGNRIGACAISSANVVNYAASGSSATTIPNAVATWTIPANCFNFIGAEFRVSGKFTFTDGGDSSTKVLVAWDASGTNTTTVPTTLCSMLDTATGTGAAYNGTYYCTVKVATVGATGTALVDGYANLKLAAGATTLVRDTTDIAVAPSASINLTGDARIVVYFIGTGATNNPGAQGLAAKLEVLN